MNKCTYVRKAKGGYEYGHIVIHHSGEKNEKREHIAQGIRPTIEEALAANGMAQAGLQRVGHSSHSLPPLWKD